MKRFTLILVASLILCSDALPIDSGSNEAAQTGKRRIGLSFYTCGVAVPAIESGFGGIGLNADGFISEFINLNASVVIGLGGGFELGYKIYPLTYTHERRWHLRFGNQFSSFSSGLFDVDKYRSISGLLGIQYIGKKGFQFAFDTGPGITNVERVKSWGTGSSQSSGSHLSYTISFGIGYRFKSAHF